LEISNFHLTVFWLVLTRGNVHYTCVWVAGNTVSSQYGKLTRHYCEMEINYVYFSGKQCVITCFLVSVNIIRRTWNTFLNLRFTNVFFIFVTIFLRFKRFRYLQMLYVCVLVYSLTSSCVMHVGRNDLFEVR